LSVFDRISVPRRHQILGLSLLVLGLLTGLALLSAADAEGHRPWSFLPVDCAGVVGRACGRSLAHLLGPTLALGIPIACLFWGANRLLLRPTTALAARTLAASVLGCFLVGLLGLGDLDGRRAGWLGQAIAVKAAGMLGDVGAHLVLWAGLLVALLALLDLGLADFLMGAVDLWRRLRARGQAFLRRLRDPMAALRAPEAVPVGAARASLEPPPPAAWPPPTPALPKRVETAPATARPADSAPGDFRSRLRAERERMAEAMAADSRPPRVARPEELEGHPGMDAQAPVLPPTAPRPERGAPARVKQNGSGAAAGNGSQSRSGQNGDHPTEQAAGAGRALSSPGDALHSATPGGDSAGAERLAPKLPAKPAAPPRPRGQDYVLPDLSVLATSAATGAQRPQESEIIRSSRLLEQTLSHFDITGKVTEVIPGPVITRYAFEPAPGVKVNQILSRSDDLALALRAHRLRILAPIPGKGAVGIEVPNAHPEVVHLGDVVRVELFERPGGLVLALGKDVSGVPVVADLKKMPHLLIAGATGSGKSVCVNAIVISLLCRLSPRDLRLVMIDPKMLELTGYNGIPQLLMPVVTEARLAAKALRFMVVEMQRRYQRLSRRGVRDIESYNASLTQHAGLTPEIPEDEEHLPYIVVIVDELADLMLTLGNEIEDPIARLAQMARAVGIHLVLATQRPSVDVITGMIKANFPSRIAFQVASKVDSRTILDQNGAEALLGRGDMLYLPAGRPDPVRIHGALVSDREIEGLVKYWMDFEPPTPALDVDRLPSREGESGGGDDPESDDLFSEARRIVVQTGIGSTSLLQRRLKVGYARAGRLMDLLEQAGVVGPPDGSKAREVLERPGDLPD
jgi:S-DNA-T family DNA segregation ATPase FtsK/SpoIIIE